MSMDLDKTSLANKFTPTDEPEMVIRQTLAMQQGFPETSVTLWAKLIRSAIAPWVDGHAVSSINAGSATTVRPIVAAVARLPDNASRLAAVVDFSRYILAKGDAESMPHAFALEELVNGWNAAHNDNAQVECSDLADGKEISE